MATHKVVKHDECSRREKAPGEGKGIHAAARSAEPGAAQSALGARRKAIHLRGRARDADTQRPLRGRSQLVIYHAMFNPPPRGPYALDTGRGLASSAPSGWTTSTASPSI